MKLDPEELPPVEAFRIAPNSTAEKIPSEVDRSCRVAQYK
jgi:hypothetical protein